MTKKIYPYYRATNWERKIEDVESWFDHFKAQGIPVAIVKNDARGEFSVWRCGFEFSEDPHGNTEPLTGRVIVEAHGFSYHGRI